MKSRAAVNSSVVSRLELLNPASDPESRLAMISLPVPLNTSLPAGFKGLASQAVDVAWWPDSRSGTSRAPRRRLLFGLGRGPLPERLTLGKPAASPAPARTMTVDKAIIHKDFENPLPHEIGEARFYWAGKSLGLRLGLRWRDQIHWWEWVRVERLWSGPLVSAWRLGGTIEAVPLTCVNGEVTGEGVAPAPGLRNPWLHRQNWLFGEVFALTFANGVISLCCRHINNHRFDEGRELNDVTPVIGFAIPGTAAPDTLLRGNLARFDLGGVRLDLSDALPLVSPEHPGSLRREGDLLIYQPYEGVEMKGDSAKRAREDGFLVRATERRFPKGVARTVRFNLGLGPDAPMISRLTAPEWWYALSGDLWPDQVLPVRDSWDERIDVTYETVTQAYEIQGRFDEGVTGSCWEGETAYAQLRYYYRTGQTLHARRALRDAYHIADLAFDHATETIRMHDYPLDGSIAPPLFRTVGLLFGYLETGDPYLLDCAESAASHWYWLDRHAWPRWAYGRDGASIRSLVFLWDYTGKEDYRTMARDALGRLIQCQLPDGSYRDQGGGTGIHAVSHMPIKPWMANLANDPIMDYLERTGLNDEPLRAAFLRYAGFLLQTQLPGEKGPCWPYEWRYGDGRYDPWFAAQPGSADTPNLPTNGFFAHGHKARALNLATRLTGDSRYFDAWLRFYDGYWRGQTPRPQDYHLFHKSLQHLPYAQAHSWNAQWTNGKLVIAPLLSEARPELEGTILTPLGPVRLRVRRTPGKPGWTLVEGPDRRGIQIAPPPRRPAKRIAKIKRDRTSPTKARSSNTPR